MQDIGLGLRLGLGLGDVVVLTWVVGWLVWFLGRRWEGGEHLREEVCTTLLSVSSVFLRLGHSYSEFLDSAANHMT